MPGLYKAGCVIEVEKEAASAPPSLAFHGHQGTETSHHPHAAPQRLSVPKPHLQPLQLQPPLPELQPELQLEPEPELPSKPEQQSEPDGPLQPTWPPEPESTIEPATKAPETHHATPPLFQAGPHPFPPLPQEQKERGSKGEEEGGQEEPAGVQNKEAELRYLSRGGGKGHRDPQMKGSCPAGPRGQ